MNKIMRLCLKDVLRGKWLVLTLAAINVIYVCLHFLDSDLFYTVSWRYESFYVIAIAVLMLPLIHLRYGDVNVEIIENVISTKVKSTALYYLGYHLWSVLLIISLAVVSAIVTAFSPNFDLTKSLLFILHLLIVFCIFSQLLITIVRVVKRYLLAAVIYLVCVFALVLLNAPNSYLWLIYSPGYSATSHWVGKIVVLLAVTCVCFSSNLFMRKIKK